MKKPVYVCLVCILLSSFNLLAAQSSGAVFDFSNAQQFMNDGNGRPLFVHNEFEIQGTPFYYDDYCVANLKVRRGKTYTGIKVKLNLQENLVIYDAGDGKEMAASSPIDRIEFIYCSDPAKNKVVVSGYPAVDKQDESSFYVLLDSGKVSLLKYIMVNYRDTKNYGSANTTRVFDQKELYYTYVPGKGMARLLKDNAAVLLLLNNKKTALEKFMAANDIKCRREDDLVKVFAYYNSLN